MATVLVVLKSASGKQWRSVFVFLPLRMSPTDDLATLREESVEFQEAVACVEDKEEEEEGSEGGGRVEEKDVDGASASSCEEALTSASEAWPGCLEEVGEIEFLKRMVSRRMREGRGEGVDPDFCISAVWRRLGRAGERRRVCARELGKRPHEDKAFDDAGRVVDFHIPYVFFH